MNDKATRRSSKSLGGLASAQFRFDTPQFAAWSFILNLSKQDCRILIFQSVLKE
jgi:hypothetical protein